MRVFGVLVGVLAVLVGALVVGGVAAGAPAAAEQRPLVAAAGPSGEPSGETGGGMSLAQTAPPGPKLDPQDQADARKNRSRLIVGVVAVVLLGIVIWGRQVRKKGKQKKK